jgi:glycosyltransferase involved in cell wall biosynthesis
MGAPRDVVFFTPYAAPLLTGAGSTGGAETQLVLLARTLHARGWRVALTVFDVPGGVPPTVDGVEIIVLPHPSPGAGRVRLIAGLLRQVDGAVVVQRAAGSHTGLVGLAARARRRRFVYSSASDFDFDATYLEHDPMARRLFPVGIRCAHAIAVQTDAQAQLCRSRWGRDSTVVRSIAEPAPQRTAPPAAFVWAGRMASYKRPEAYVELAARVPEARFWMAGHTSAQIRAMAAHQPNLELLGSLPRAQLTALLDRAVAVVSTSVKEGMPNVFLEGWARGVPALALSHDPDTIIERHGLGAVAGDSLDRLAELTAAAWEGRHDQTAIATRCRTYVEREHAADKVAARWEGVLGLGRTRSSRSQT